MSIEQQLRGKGKFKDRVTCICPKCRTSWVIPKSQKLLFCDCGDNNAKTASPRDNKEGLRS